MNLEKLQKKREIYYPKDFEVRLTSDKAPGLEVFLLTNRNNKPAVVAFAGQQQKPGKRYYFMKPEQRAKWVEDFVNNQVKRAEEKAQAAAEKKNWKHDLKVGDILVQSWGYEQTNVDFYEVTALVGKAMVEIRELAQSRTHEGFMTGNCAPVPGKYIGPAMRKRPTRGYEGKAYVKIYSFSGATKWDGTVRNWSSYH